MTDQLQQFTVSKTYRTCTAHYLDNYVGKCANLHGHNYVFKVSVHLMGVGLSLDHANMLTDFGELKRFCKEFIEPWDHALITPMGQEEVEQRLAVSYRVPPGHDGLAAWGLRDITRIIGFGENPTAEAMARFLTSALADMVEQDAISLPYTLSESAQCNVKVEVWETDDSMAEHSLRIDLTGPRLHRHRMQEQENALATVTALADAKRKGVQGDTTSGCHQ